MATESTESTDPHPSLVFGFRPRPLRWFGLALVCALDESLEMPGRLREQNTQNTQNRGGGCVSVDSVAIRGGAEGPAENGGTHDRAKVNVAAAGRWLFCNMNDSLQHIFERAS